MNVFVWMTSYADFCMLPRGDFSVTLQKHLWKLCAADDLTYLKKWYRDKWNFAGDPIFFGTFTISLFVHSVVIIIGVLHQVSKEVHFKVSVWKQFSAHFLHIRCICCHNVFVYGRFLHARGDFSETLQRDLAKLFAADDLTYLEKWYRDKW